MDSTVRSDCTDSMSEIFPPDDSHANGGVINRGMFFSDFSTFPSHHLTPTLIMLGSTSHRRTLLRSLSLTFIIPY